jgi:DNA-nicking Smr family endonuclease
LTREQSHLSDEAALFQAAVADVKKLLPTNKITPKKPLKSAVFFTPKPLSQIKDVLSDFANDEPAAEFLRNGITRMSMKKLRRHAIQDRLDLHGLSSDAARVLLQEFLQHACEQTLRCVLVIHGKGINSKAGVAILKIRTRHWLMQHDSVLAYCDALENQGGSGAVLVLLRA